MNLILLGIEMGRLVPVGWYPPNTGNIGSSTHVSNRMGVATSTYREKK